MNAPEERPVRSVGELPRQIEPARDLWPQIEARLERARPATPALVNPQLRRPPLARLRWLAAAAMVASVAVGVWIGRDFLPEHAASPVVSGPLRPTPAVPAGPDAETLGGTALDARFVSDPRYQRERAELLKSLQARLAALPPPARAKVSASLATIQRAKEDLESALGKDPSNALLQELLINTYQDEMRALTDVHEAGDPGRGI
ncbi:MAG TPA: hypothetical protein VH109_09075 [Steroidobacteraceae bacterium]|jgi:hypothetical protein|nr:hypothetical protein [Steroidobacteraceae bacterium]